MVAELPLQSSAETRDHGPKSVNALVHIVQWACINHTPGPIRQNDFASLSNRPLTFVILWVGHLDNWTLSTEGFGIICGEVTCSNTKLNSVLFLMG